MYRESCPKKRTEEPLPVECTVRIDYKHMSDYIKRWPEKLVAFVADRLCDDDFQEFTRELYGYICEPDEYGPAFEEWRV